MKIPKDFTRDDFGHRLYRAPAELEARGSYWVSVPEEAVVDRAALYGTTTDDDTMKHIIWEHYLAHYPESSVNEMPADVRANFDRVWGPEHKAQRRKPMTAEEVTQQHERIRATRNTPRRVIP